MYDNCYASQSFRKYKKESEKNGDFHSHLDFRTVQCDVLDFLLNLILLPLHSTS